ncbi:MAG: mandelate racemase [Flavobacteriales bacterium MED-G22]|nr:mandelate racemase/muconate lactonizing enzyme family protein [Flavobacteriaceae bacterium]PDH44725.1 MAG: mandelate racemase [Flavobacteriales bacterium MED-G22]
MKISKINLYEVVVPAKKGTIESSEINKPLHKLSQGTEMGWSIQFDELSKILISIELANGVIGWGECYRGNTIMAVKQVAQKFVGMSIEKIIRQQLPIPYTRIYDGFECALWDCFARLKNVRVVDLLGGPVREKIKVGSWSSHRTTAEVGEIASNFAALGYDCIKFKTDLEDDVAGWATAIKRAAPDMKIIFDPNERWISSAEVKTRIDALKEIGNTLCIEDPISRWKIEEYAQIRSYSPIPIVLHVSLPYVDHGQRVHDAIRAIQHQAIDGFNFNCGFAHFQKLDHIATAAELPCWHGSEIDLGIMEAMYLHSCAAAHSCEWPSDIFGTLIRSHDLLKQSLRIEPPFAFLPEGIGLGVEPDLEAINEYLINKIEVAN